MIYKGKEFNNVYCDQKASIRNRSFFYKNSQVKPKNGCSFEVKLVLHMWQRIQTAYLIVFAVIFLGWVAFDVPIGKLSEFDENTKAAAASTALADGVYQAKDYSMLTILSLMASILAIANVFLYKNRPLQSKMTLVLVFAAITSSIFGFYFLYLDIQTIQVLSTSPFSPSFGAFVPILGVVLAMMAKRAIDKDEKIVRSMDRLR